MTPERGQRGSSCLQHYMPRLVKTARLDFSVRQSVCRKWKSGDCAAVNYSRGGRLVISSRVARYASAWSDLSFIVVPQHISQLAGLARRNRIDPNHLPVDQ